ncbi:hypothetical protein KY340_01380 [Candidatus Woesearchaeota archaeon]|nr:hypothetical protein [Candidatus Woesearchaeota archaeon]
MKRILLALMIIALVVAVGCAKQVTEKPAAPAGTDSVAEVEAGTAALDEMEQDLDPDNVEGLDDIGSLFEDY